MGSNEEKVAAIAWFENPEEFPILKLRVGLKSSAPPPFAPGGLYCLKPRTLFGYLDRSFSIYIYPIYIIKISQEKFSPGPFLQIPFFEPCPCYSFHQDFRRPLDIRCSGARPAQFHWPWNAMDLVPGGKAAGSWLRAGEIDYENVGRGNRADNIFSGFPAK